MLEICNVSKKYRKKVALNNVSFGLKEGVYGLIGENGAGKTTIMKILTRQIQYDTGSIIYQKEKWNDKNKLKVGYLPQNFDFFGNLTVLESLIYLLEIRGITIRNKEEQIIKWLEYLNLVQQIDKKVKKLSGGMKQRLGIAQAFMGEPEIILLDEPTVGLDPRERLAFRNMVNEVCDNKIILISTHILDDVESTCERMISLKSGKVTYEGKVSDFICHINSDVYTITIHRKDLYKIGKEISIISIKREGEKLHIRFIINDMKLCEESDIYMAESLKKVEKNLEDAYFFHTDFLLRR